MVLPVVVYVAVAALYPVGLGISYSLFRYNLLRPNRTLFVGFGNYVDLWSDPAMRASLINTLVFTVSAVTLEFILGLGLALLLWRDRLASKLALALLLVPVAVTPLCAGLIFHALLTPDYGPIGYWARVIGLSGEHGFL
eukprot:gene21172-21972_t